ncbi:MAG: sulfatase-like hydrolase/transferase [Acidimicrobiia bacterium]|nr:sulfatase-like hydrolase/transferase [Acidimicrobiia bacterium]
MLIVFDEFPTLTLLDEKGMIDGDLFPSFSALADDATWYRNATTVHALTHMSVPAIQTGQIPSEDTAAPTAAVYPESIFTLLGDSYAMNSVQEYTVCPTSLCPSPYSESPSQILGDLLSKSVDIFAEQLTASADDSDVDTASGGPIEGRTRMVRHDERSSKFVAGIDGGQTLSAAHLLVPHHFWVFNPSGTVSNSEYEEAYPVRTGGWGDPESAAVGRQHHLLQAMYIDSVVGDVIDQLEAVGAYDDALIIITADHGISFEPGEPRRLSTAASVPEVAWVPMFVKFPDQDVGVVSDENAMTIDVVPTIAEIVGIDIPWDVDGISLVSETRDESDKVFLPYADNPEDFYPFGETVDGEAGLNTLLSRAKRRFVHTADPRDRPFARGRYGSLVGGRVTDFNVEEPLESAAVREDDRDTEPVDAGGGLEREMAATWVAGSLGDDFGADPQLAYVIDGTIVATSGVFEPEGGRRHFETLLPEDAIDAGPLEMYLIEGTLDRPTLREVRFES